MNQNTYEQILETIIFPELEKGRPDFDKPHTKAVVFYMKEIIRHSPELDLDKDVLTIAAYAHDWGYADLFESGKEINLDQIKAAKKIHMEIGAQKIAHLINTKKEFEFLTSFQKERIVHLVSVHDMLDRLTELDEILLMEADTLGGLDVTRVTPGFDEESNARYMQGVKEKRYPLFRSDYGKKIFDQLFDLRENFYKSK